jgi:hypothetical protein
MILMDASIFYYGKSLKRKSWEKLGRPYGKSTPVASTG